MLQDFQPRSVLRVLWLLLKSGARSQHGVALYDTVIVYYATHRYEAEILKSAGTKPRVRAYEHVAANFSGTFRGLDNYTVLNDALAAYFYLVEITSQNCIIPQTRVFAESHISDCCSVRGDEVCLR